MADDKPRHIAISAADGHTGMAVAELLLRHDKFKGAVSSVTALTYSDGAEAKQLEKLGAEVVTIEERGSLKGAMESIDTMLIIPPARADKFKQVQALLQEAKRAKTVKNVVLLSSVGADYANREQQPRLREFVDLEILAMAPKSDPSTGDTGHCPCIVRAGFYAENLLAYSHQAQDQAKLPIPIDQDHKFAPVSLGDIALLLATIVTSKGPHGLSDAARGQLFTITGPMMTAGPELAEAASQAFGSKLTFQSITEKEAKKILDDIPTTEMDDSEKEYLMEYYSLVKQGKTNYIATAGFEMLTGQPLQSLTDFFTSYKDAFKPKRRRTSK